MKNNTKHKWSRMIFYNYVWIGHHFLESSGNIYFISKNEYAWGTFISDGEEIWNTSIWGGDEIIDTFIWNEEEILNILIYDRKDNEMSLHRYNELINTLNNMRSTLILKTKEYNDHENYWVSVMLTWMHWDVDVYLILRKLWIVNKCGWTVVLL